MAIFCSIVLLVAVIGCACVVNHQLKVTVLPRVGHPCRLPTGIEILCISSFDVQFTAPASCLADSAGGRCQQKPVGCTCMWCVWRVCVCGISLCIDVLSYCIFVRQILPLHVYRRVRDTICQGAVTPIGPVQTPATGIKMNGY